FTDIWSIWHRLSCRAKICCVCQCNCRGGGWMMVFPGVGTVVGGFVGAAAAGFAANTVLGEPVRQLGEKICGAVEKAGKAVANTAKKAVETVSNATNLLSGGA